MKVLVTGAAGFLGSHLMLRHMQQGDTALGIDNFCSSNPNSEHVRLIKRLCEQDRRRGMLFNGDISTSEPGEGLWAALTEFQLSGLGERFDVIYNFACPASPPLYQKMPIETMMTCVAGTSNVLDMAGLHKAIVVHASTSEVYGDPEHSPQRESYRGRVNSYGPRACYDEGKRAAEALCYDYLNKCNVDARVVRIFNTYGPHMDPHDGRVVSNFICQALRAEPLTVYGDGQQTRSFCYVDDLIRGIVGVASLPKNPHTPINLGNPNEFTVYKLAQEVVKRLGGSVSRHPLPVDDPTQRCPDISKAKELLGWEPKVQLEDGLDMTIRYFKGVLEHSR